MNSFVGSLSSSPIYECYGVLTARSDDRLSTRKATEVDFEPRDRMKTAFVPVFRFLHAGDVNWEYDERERRERKEREEGVRPFSEERL